MAASATWTKPKSIIAGTTMLADYLNTHWRDNLYYLKTRPSFETWSLSGSTTTSATFVEMTNSSNTIVTDGGYILFWASGRIQDSTGGAVVGVDLAIDGIRQGDATYGATLVQGLNANYADNLNLMMITGGGTGGSLLAAGEHTCALHWKTNAGTATAYLHLFAMEIC